MAQIDLKELLQAGAHFGHQTKRWNPKMKPYLYGARDQIHIIDLTKTAQALEDAVAFVQEVASNGGQLLFVGTKRQARPIVKAEAEAIGMPYVTERWLGGLLTNFRTIKTQVSRLKQLSEQLASGELEERYNKKELAQLLAEARKLDQVLGGVAAMDNLPAALFVVDIAQEDIAVREAGKLGIPIVAITDSNTNPELVTYPIPANDDAIKTIQLITHTVAVAAAEGAKLYQSQRTEEGGQQTEDTAPKVSKEETIKSG